MIADFNLCFFLTIGLTHPEILINTLVTLTNLFSHWHRLNFFAPAPPGLSPGRIVLLSLLSSLSHLGSSIAVFVCRTFPNPLSLFLSILDLVRKAEGETGKELQSPRCHWSHWDWQWKANNEPSILIFLRHWTDSFLSSRPGHSVVQRSFVLSYRRDCHTHFHHDSPTYPFVLN